MYYIHIHIDFFKLLKRQPRCESGLLYLYKCPDFNYNIAHDDDSDDVQRIQPPSLPLGKLVYLLYNLYLIWD